MKRYIFLVLLLTTLIGAQAQKGSVRGRVTDARTGENIEYSIEIPFEMPHFVRQPKPAN